MLKSSNLLNLSLGETISKRAFLSIIKLSKDHQSPNYEGEKFKIYGQPPRGILWIGQYPNIKAIIAKSRIPNSNPYFDDYLNSEKTKFRYYLQRFGMETNLGHEHNFYFTNQKTQGSYPILLFLETVDQKNWQFEGKFDVVSINNSKTRSLSFCDLLKR